MREAKPNELNLNMNIYGEASTSTKVVYNKALYILCAVYL